MAKKETTDVADIQWQVLQPGWGQDDFKGERRLLYESLKEGEIIERLYGCRWQSGGENHDRGIVAATDRRLLLLNRGRFTKNVADASYLSIWEVDEQGRDKLIIRTPNETYNLALERGAGEFAGFLRERTTSSDASWEVWLSRMLPSEERVESWALCSAGVERVVENGKGKGESSYEDTHAFDRPALAVATEGHTLFYEAYSFSGDELIPSCPLGSILSVEYWGDTGVRFVKQTGEIYAVKFQQDTEAAYLAGLIREHAGTAAQRVAKETRISAEWKLQHPIWDHRNNHGTERSRLGEIMEDDEHIEALAWG